MSSQVFIPQQPPASRPDGVRTSFPLYDLAAFRRAGAILRPWGASRRPAGAKPVGAWEAAATPAATARALASP